MMWEVLEILLLPSVHGHSVILAPPGQLFESVRNSGNSYCYCPSEINE
jgi:hypothetical protein